MGRPIPELEASFSQKSISSLLFERNTWGGTAANRYRRHNTLRYSAYALHHGKSPPERQRSLSVASG
jgi:hypothetical protein